MNREKSANVQLVKKEYQNLKHLLRSSDHERRLIAYEIHDGLAQHLAAAIMQLQAFDNLKDKNREAAAAFDAGIAMLRQGHFETRRLIAGVRPPILDEAGIAEAISHLVLEQSRCTGQAIDEGQILTAGRTVRTAKTQLELQVMKSTLLLAIALLTAALALPNGAVGQAAPLNIIFFLVDDMGWTDVGYMGSPFYETPHIDRLAAEGMRFNQAYSACTVCSPTRAAILTGQYPARLHITDWIAGHVEPYAKLKVPDWTMHLPPETTNAARLLKPAGFAAASIGKWHLGGPAFYPDKQGFDVNIAGTAAGQPPSYFAPYKIATLPEGPAGEFLSDRLTDEALKFIETNKSRPFFLYLPHYAVHTPLMAKPRVIEKYKKKADPRAPQHNAVYAGLVESVDDSIGRIMKKLDELKLADHTIVIFNSDNGGLIGSTVNLGLRAGKGSAYEGGVRVPLVVKWPGVTRAGSVCETPVISVDYLPTLLEMTGVKDGSKQPLDGESLVPLLRQSGPLKREAIYWHYPHYHPGGATPYGAVREGDFKLIEFYEDDHVELYNLKDDLAEKNDLANVMPERAAALRQKLHQWRADVGAQMPSPNPAYRPNPAPKSKQAKKRAAEEIQRVLEES